VIVSIYFGCLILNDYLYNFIDSAAINFALFDAVVFFKSTYLIYV